MDQTFRKEKASESSAGTLFRMKSHTDTYYLMVSLTQSLFCVARIA